MGRPSNVLGGLGPPEPFVHIVRQR